MSYQFSHNKLFTADWLGGEDQGREIGELEKACNNFFYNSNKRKLGINKGGELCLRGFRLRHYFSGTIEWEPIVFNITTSQTVIDEERVEFIDRVASEDYEMHLSKAKDYKGIKNICFIFFDGLTAKEYLFNFNYPYTKGNIIDFSNELKEHFYTKVIREKEKQMLESSSSKKQSKSL